jgi:hypothetical protein
MEVPFFPGAGISIAFSAHAPLLRFAIAKPVGVEQAGCQMLSV